MKWIIAALVIWLAWRVLRPSQRRVPSEDAAARALLGVGAGADADEIRAAHRRLAAAAHPDRGGDAAHAARLNAARDRLLTGLRGRG